MGDGVSKKELLPCGDRYLSLIEKTLVGTIYEDPPLGVFGDASYNEDAREHGLDWPSVAYTMVGVKRLRNFRMLISSALEEGIEGDIVETGVWRGGACILARAVLEAYNEKQRRVIVCDSFGGLPPPDSRNFPSDADSSFHTYSDLSVSLERVKSNFAKFDLLDDQVFFLKGWFRDTMKLVPSDKIAVLRLDGDMYESTIDPLKHLYDRVPDGGWVIVDDYHVVPQSKAAVHDFLDDRGETVTLNDIDGVGVYFRKGEG